MNWDPLHELVALRQRAARRATEPDAAWAPSVDLLETDAAFHLVVELPGLAPGDVSISATGDALVVAGERKPVTPLPLRYLRMERGYGRFSRRFSFGQPIDAHAIGAHFDRGVLTVTVPKAGPSATRRIDIS